jgi:ribonuclease HI
LGDNTDHNVATIYGPKGQFINHIPKETLTTLWARYQGAKNNTTHAQPTSFPEDVAALVTRYQTGTFSKDGPEIQLDGQQALQPKIYQAILNMFPNIKDRLASPLTVQQAVNHYWTAHKHDTLFGAQYDAYSVQWTGCSIAHPAHTPEATSKAISWAVRSAQATAQPTLTIVMAYHPTHQATNNTKPEPYYQRWVDTYPQYCKIKATLDTSIAHYVEPNIWDLAHPKTPKRNTKCTLLVIANEAGFDTYPQWGTLQECFQAHPSPDIDTEPPGVRETPHTPREPSNTMYRTHKKLRNLPSDQVPSHTKPTTAEAQAEVERIYPYRYPPKWDWQQFAYTDGSVIAGTKTGPGIGAAVYLPPRATHDHGEDITIPIDPSTTNENTINRAELAAIWVALQKGAEHIATDSQCSINQIQKMLNRPHDMREHRHQNLLNHIVELITQRETTTTLYKVKAHTGITGNETADAMAKQVANGANPEGTLHDVPESNLRREKYWVKHKAIPTPDNPNPQAKTLPTLDQHLRNAVHQQHKLGMADQSTIYYSSWKNTMPHMLAAESNAFMTKQTVTTKERRTALQYRCGQLYNNKLGMRWGHVTTDNCPLCGRPDGGHHIASGCPKLQNMYTERHHKAGRIILKAILKGEKAAEAAYADVGSAANLAKDEVPDIDNRHNLRLPPTSSRPDIILVSTTQRQQRHISSITLVEIKYCRDSDLTPQLENAISQHQALSTQLQQTHKCSIQTLPILLGVSGAVYSTYTAQALQQLGIRGSLLKTTLRRLHTQAIQSLGSIVSTRRHYERKHQPANGQRRRQHGGKGPRRGPRTARHRDNG